MDKFASNRNLFSKTALLSAALCAASAAGLVAMLIAGSAAIGAPPSQDARRLKNDIDREARERLQRLEQQRKEEQWKRDWQERQQRDAQERARREAQWNAQQQAASTAKTPAFNAATAPSPDDCLKRFILAAMNANSMEQLMAYLPENEQKTLRDKQANFDSQGVSDKSEYVIPPTGTFDEQPASASLSPFEAALKSSKSFARQVTDILDTKINGDQAQVTVATGYMINGRPVPDGKAVVEMVGEGSYWRLKTRSGSPLVRKQSQNNP